MDLIVTGIVAGVLGTLVMDSLIHLLARIGILLKIDVRMIGRMSSGWANGRFSYRHPDEMKQVANALIYGYIIFRAVGVGLAVPFVLGWAIFVGVPLSPVWVLTHGVVTTIASVFFVYPSMGLGLFGWRSPEGIRAPLSSLANHFFFGLGMAVAVAIV